MNACYDRELSHPVDDGLLVCAAERFTTVIVDSTFHTCISRCGYQGRGSWTKRLPFFCWFAASSFGGQLRLSIARGRHQRRTALAWSCRCFRRRGWSSGTTTITLLRWSTRNAFWNRSESTCECMFCQTTAFTSTCATIGTVSRFDSSSLWFIAMIGSSGPSRGSIWVHSGLLQWTGPSQGSIRVHSGLLQWNQDIFSAVCLRLINLLMIHGPALFQLTK